MATPKVTIRIALPSSMKARFSRCYYPPADTKTLFLAKPRQQGRDFGGRGGVVLAIGDL